MQISTYRIAEVETFGSKISNSILRNETKNKIEMNKSVGVFVLIILSVSCCATQSQFGIGEPMEYVALQAINNMTETSANLPEDLQQAIVQLRETTVQGFANCNEIQTTTMQIWQYKKCAALHLRMVTMTLTAIQREAELRAAATTETSNVV